MIMLEIGMQIIYFQSSKLATNDISKGPIYKNNYTRALKSIKAKTILMPCNQDLYFRTEDNKYEEKFIPNSSLRPGRFIFWSLCSKSWK